VLKNALIFLKKFKLKEFAGTKDEIQNAFTPLIGMPLWDIGRIADLECFCFGENRREVSSKLKNGQKKVVSDYALHLTCSWLIAEANQVLVASDDRFFHAGDDPFLDYEQFNWNSPEGNRLDERIAQLNAKIQRKPLIVNSVEADELGGLIIHLSENYSLSVFPNTSFSEYWRLFEPGIDSPHFVVTAKGIESEED
jgi:hypothetical protein